MTPCVSQVCTLPAAFADDIRGYAGGGVRAVEVWLTKLEQHLETTSADDTRALLADHGVSLPAAAYHGGLLLSQGEARTAALDHFKRRLDLCQTFGVRTLVLAADHARPEVAAIGRAMQSLAEAGRWAAGFGERNWLTTASRRDGEATAEMTSEATESAEKATDAPERRATRVCSDSYSAYRASASAPLIASR